MRLIQSFGISAEAVSLAGLTDGLTPASLATHLRVSRPLLDLRFSELKRGTVVGAIRKRQLNEVGRLLRETNYTIRQIGARCGFRNERSLKNIFLREFKMTMTSYRNRSKQSTSFFMFI